MGSMDEGRKGRARLGRCPRRHGGNPSRRAVRAVAPLPVGHEGSEDRFTKRMVPTKSASIAFNEVEY